ncbi:MAG: triose-phosphate isomerase [Desulfobulbus propionicus]|nr:MAG: triose-phosphate isomerase [Desulfobulbus propionicus]
MSRRPLLAGNWKMNLTLDESVALAVKVAESADKYQDRDVMIAPAFTALQSVKGALAGSPVFLASQNICWAQQGAFTGDISPLMLKELDVSMAIIGHSERRQLFFEDDAMINRRVKGALANDIIPVLCLGETLEEREANRTFAVLSRQLQDGLAGCTLEEVKKIVFAYEPVWAIGTGKTATREQAQEVHTFLRELIAEKFEKTLAGGVRILYGGSVKPDNIDALIAQPDIDGVLVGGAALNYESFSRIIAFT